MLRLVQEQLPSEDEVWGVPPERSDAQRGQRILLIVGVVLFLLLAGISYAAMQGEDHSNMPGMDMEGM